MNAEAAEIGPARAGLPSIPAYLIAIWDLGRRSLRPALPALAFLYFYRVGVGAYMALSSDTYTQGADALATVGPQIAVVASFLPLLLLVYTPFLPLQDSLLRGRSMSFLAAIRRVFEGSWNFTLSGIVQALALFVPFALIGALAALVLPDGGAETGSPRVLFMGFVFLACFAWALLLGLFMIFATPAVVLDGEGPVQSLRTSFHLVKKNLGGLLGRLLAFGLFSIAVYVVATMPSAILGAVEHASGAASAPLKLAGVIWTSAADTLFFPFWVAALMTLYRALRPPDQESRSAPVAMDDEYRPAAARAPFE